MSDPPEFRIGQRAHSAGDSRRIGTVKYVGPVEGYSGKWVGVDWDNADGGKHDGSLNGVRYFHAESEKSGSFVRPHNLSAGITLLKALEIRYKSISTQEEEDEMYVFSASNRRVSVQLLGKDKIQDKLSRFEELANASLFYLGVSSSGPPCQISATIPNLKELDLTGNLLSDWKDVGAICEGLPALVALNLTNNLMAHDILGLPQLRNIRVLVLNNTGIKWIQVEMLKCSLPVIEELHLMGNKLNAITIGDNDNGLGAIGLNLWEVGILDRRFDGDGFSHSEVETPLSSSQSSGGSGFVAGEEEVGLCSGDWRRPPSSDIVQGFDSLRLLNLEDNCIADWNEILKLSQLKSLEQLHLNKNSINRLWYPEYDTVHDQLGCESVETSGRPFQNLRCLLLGGNNIEDLASVDSLNSFPNLKDIRLSENQIADPGKGGLPRFVLIARLAQVDMLNGSEVSCRERKDSEIRYVRLVMSKLHDHPKEITLLHPRSTVDSGIFRSARSQFSFEGTSWPIINMSSISFDAEITNHDSMTTSQFEAIVMKKSTTPRAGENNLGATEKMEIGEWLRAFFGRILDIGELTMPPITRSIRAVGEKMRDKVKRGLVMRGIVNSPMSKILPENAWSHSPRFLELKEFHGIEDEKPSTGAAGPQKMASGLISITLKCVGASMGEKPPLTKKLPAPTTVGKLKILCESFFKLKSVKPVLFLEEEGSPLPTVLDDDMATLIDVGVGNDSTVLVDEES
ncbi:hypothetical protein RHMOL_Rhmol02G0216600 [Rhododendron molle]|uniref:Uncharacterized protein n=1 Tax=Rhododendron molle TaxID=49168 RepID=A0ACC0PSS9_RHOML|nr:hypothetical protein RHMOL_Rhmol02G0216600 [Rhododendron molle]